MDILIEKENVPNAFSISRINWGAITGGTLLGIFSQILLGLLGLAIGITAFHPGQAITAGMSVGAGIYIVAITIVSVYIGAFAAGRFAGFVSRYDGLFHGVTTLALLTVISLFTISAGIGTFVGGSLSYGLNAARFQQSQQIAFSNYPVQVYTTGAAASLSPKQRLYFQQQADRVAAGTIWLAFITAFLSLIAAAFGGVMGMKSRLVNDSYV